MEDKRTEAEFLHIIFETAFEAKAIFSEKKLELGADSSFGIFFAFEVRFIF